MKEVCDFLKKCGAYYLATTDSDQPRVRPFGTAEIFEGRLYIQTGRSKDVSGQMGRNPKVELCAFDGETWIRIQATAVDDDRRGPKEHMLEAYPMLKSMYSPDDGNTQTLYLKDATATFYSMTGSPRVVRF